MIQTETTYAKRKRKGLCIDCPSRRGRNGTSIRCRPCADAANVEDRVRRSRPEKMPPCAPVNVIRARLDADLCITCGSPSAGLWRCPRCDLARSIARAA